MKQWLRNMTWVMAVGAVASGCASTRAAAPGITEGEPVRTAATAEGVQGAPGVEPFTSDELGFELDKPAGEEWAVATNVTSPEGRPIPVVVAHPKSGAQIVVQVSEMVDTPKALAAMLREKLEEEQMLQLGSPEKLSMDAGSDAYGFNFGVKGEANGRVAVINVGEQIVLVVASWPEGAAKTVVDDIDHVVKSVRAPTNASPIMLRPDKV